MKIVNIIGGLGNQMFQYALYIALKETYKDECIKIDTSLFRGYNKHNGFELDRIFNISYETASLKDLLRLNFPFMNYRIWQIGRRITPNRKSTYKENKKISFDKNVFQKDKDFYYDGYWQNENYFIKFRDKVLETFSSKELLDIRNQELVIEIEKGNSASIHFRRGDYVGNKIYKNICDEEYYQRAIKILSKEKKIDKFYVFSDDIEWAISIMNKSQQEYIPITWNKGKDSYKDMIVMSKCKHNIIANSSFSWWGAWLNKNEEKIVIAPKVWNNVNKEQEVVPNNWIKI